MSEISIRLELSKKDLADEKLAAKNVDFKISKVELVKSSKDIALDEARFVEILAVIVELTIPYLAKRIAEHWLKKEQGLQIDLRTTPTSFSKLANVPKGFILIIDKDGNPKIEKTNYEKPEDIIPLLLTIFSK